MKKNTEVILQQDGFEIWVEYQYSVIQEDKDRGLYDTELLDVTIYIKGKPITLPLKSLDKWQQDHIIDQLTYG